MEMGLITEIERYAVHDGPGIRTLVFLKGCPLRCQWCANPETHHSEPELYYDRDQCQLCGECLQACPEQVITFDAEEQVINTDHSRCVACGRCQEVCPAGARDLVGDYYTVDEVLAIIKKDMVYYRTSGGGVTLSGGEVLQQPKFTAALLKKCREEYIHTVLETSGYGDFSVIEDLLKYTDLIFYDIKHMDRRQHRLLTGKDNQVILENLKKIKKNYRQQVIIRVPLIAGVNDYRENILALRELALATGVERIELLPYHSLGVSKYRWLERNYPGRDFQKPGKEQLNFIQQLLEAKGLKTNIS